MESNAKNPSKTLDTYTHIHFLHKRSLHYLRIYTHTHTIRDYIKKEKHYTQAAAAAPIRLRQFAYKACRCRSRTENRVRRAINELVNASSLSRSRSTYICYSRTREPFTRAITRVCTLYLHTCARRQSRWIEWIRHGRIAKIERRRGISVCVCSEVYI